MYSNNRIQKNIVVNLSIVKWIQIKTARLYLYALSQTPKQNRFVKDPIKPNRPRELSATNKKQFMTRAHCSHW